MEKELRDTKKKFTSFVEDHNNLKIMLQEKETELQQISGDLNMIARDNQSLNL